MYDAPKPFDLWTRGHIANDPRWTRRWAPSTLPVIVRQYADFPPLFPDMRAGGLNLYAESTVNRWFEAVDQWVKAKPTRDASRRVEADRQFLARQDAKQRALEANAEAFDQMQQGSAEGRALAERQRYTGPITRG